MIRPSDIKNSLARILEPSTAARLVRRTYEAVADPAHRLDVVPSSFELLAQPLHVRVYGAGGDVRLNAPDIVEQGGSSLHTISALVQLQEQLEFQRGQLDLGL